MLKDKTQKTLFIVVLLPVILPVADLVGGQHKDDTSDRRPPQHRNATRHIIFEMGGKIEKGTGRGTTVSTSGRWDTISTKKPQSHYHSMDETDDSPSQHFSPLSQSPRVPPAHSLSSWTQQLKSSADASEPLEKGRYIIPIPKSIEQSTTHHRSPYPYAIEHRHFITRTHHSIYKRKRHLLSLTEHPLPHSSAVRANGPYFESNQTTIHISAKAGENVSMSCTVIMLQGRTVSWLRRGEESLQLLTVGNVTYDNDPRLSLRFRYPDNWRLSISSLQKKDEGEYQCQVSTYPVKTLYYHLMIIAPLVVVQDENGHSVTERHYKVGSSLHLTCKAFDIDQFEEKAVWLKGHHILRPETDNRLKIKARKGDEIGESFVYLTVLWLRLNDSDIYSCKVGTYSKSSVTVHVVNGDLPAAVQRENNSSRISLCMPTILLISIPVSIAVACQNEDDLCLME